MQPLDTQLISKLRSVLGDAGLLIGENVDPRYHTDPRGVGDVRPAVVMRPASTDELSRAMSQCFAATQPIVVQGGLTGLVVGARPQHGEFAVSLERMNQIEQIDPKAGTITVQAGVALQTIQEAADAVDMVYPLDLGARGSATIGGNLSTNAGGNRVIRYGMTRDLTLGLEAVLADGTVINSLNGYLKNNTGYDLKQMFIGSEGTLGLITRATLRLYPKPKTQVVAFCAVDRFDAVSDLMIHMRAGLGADLSAFEVVWSKTYDAILREVASVKAPVPAGHGFYVLVEMMGSDPTTDNDKFETCLEQAMERGLIVDAVVSRSHAEIAALWDVRDGMAEAMGKQQPAVGFDISLAVDDMKTLEDELLRRLQAALGNVRLYIGGHLADGNLHLVAKTTDDGPQPRDQIQDIVYGYVAEVGGSISAEHGIGLLKKGYLGQNRTDAEMALMRRMKRALDPKNLLNPDRVFTLHENDDIA
ncbi:FAD-binding oxidoreductase [Amylibacter sp. IMCC11727]|uniref:FAD-binding oxidoreductase n=1 Tax=Amylibacter sp. IMCC11727 TaxID=3039851 RepID=UPI00244DD590|nr:FAD-binding oxidoreductase [Amylibacter sp. IMCC11727]WGI23519.1 FAD-binding oxidoreductase [Amylibacter sp. IMCC11727]